MRGELTIRGERVDLSRMRANLLNVIARSDHITPSCQSEPIMAKVGSADKELVPDQRWPHRNHGRQRRQQVHLAPHQRMASPSLEVTP